jgi:hypothetical protein
MLVQCVDASTLSAPLGPAAGAASQRHSLQVTNPFFQSPVAWFEH